jgi:hypothetical protein
MCKMENDQGVTHALLPKGEGWGIDPMTSATDEADGLTFQLSEIHEGESLRGNGESSIESQSPRADSIVNREMPHPTRGRHGRKPGNAFGLEWI